MKTVLVMGAAGRLGDAAARGFLARGWKVRGMARTRHLGDLAPGVEAVEGDAFDLPSLVRAADGAEVIVNAINPLYTEWEEKVLPMARNVIAAAGTVGALQMLPGNVYNFGLEIGMNMREGDPAHGSTPKARIRVEMEELFRREADAKGARTVVLRAGDFYGGTRKGTWLDELIFRRLKSGVFVWPGPMELPHAFAYLPDLGHAFAAVAGEADRLSPFEVLHFAGHTLDGNQFKALAEKAVGRKLARRGVPWTLLRAAGLVMPMMREIATMSYLWRVPHSLDGSKLEALVPGLAATPPADAVAAAIADLGLYPAAAARAA